MFLRRRIRFRIKASECTTIETVLDAVKQIQKSYPNAEISVEMEVDGPSA